MKFSNLEKGKKLQNGKNRKHEGKGIQEEQSTGEDMQKLNDMDTNRKMRKQVKNMEKMGSSTVAGRQKNGLHAVEE